MAAGSISSIRVASTNGRLFIGSACDPEVIAVSASLGSETLAAPRIE